LLSQDEMHPEIVGSLARLPQCPVCGQRNQRSLVSVRHTSVDPTDARNARASTTIGQCFRLPRQAV
jgi:hypothetical protein